jgi:hypothetical protein
MSFRKPVRCQGWSKRPSHRAWSYGISIGDATLTDWSKEKSRKDFEEK